MTYIRAGNDDIHKSLDEFEKLMFPYFLALYNGSQVSIVALWATCLAHLSL